MSHRLGAQVLAGVRDVSGLRLTSLRAEAASLLPLVSADLTIVPELQNPRLLHFSQFRHFIL